MAALLLSALPLALGSPDSTCNLAGKCVANRPAQSAPRSPAPPLRIPTPCLAP